MAILFLYRLDIFRWHCWPHNVWRRVMSKTCLIRPVIDFLPVIVLPKVAVLTRPTPASFFIAFISLLFSPLLSSCRLYWPVQLMVKTCPHPGQDQSFGFVTVTVQPSSHPHSSSQNLADTDIYNVYNVRGDTTSPVSGYRFNIS